MVRINVVFGEIFGSTANEESPTSPRVTLLKAFLSIGRPRCGATEDISTALEIDKI